MEDFKYDTKSKASVTAHALVYIFKLHHSNLEYNGIHDNVLSYSKFIKNGKNDMSYIERSKLYESKRKYYYFNDRVRKNLSQTCNDSFTTKSKLLNLYKYDKNNQCEWLLYLMDGEKTGMIRPSYDLWTKILWFLPFEYILVLFHHYQVRCEKAQVEKKRLFKQSEKDSGSNAKSSLYDMQRGLSLVQDLIDVNLADDVIYICSQIIPIIDSDVDKLLDAYVKKPASNDSTTQYKNETNDENQLLSKKIELLSNPVDNWEDFEL